MRNNFFLIFTFLILSFLSSTIYSWGPYSHQHYSKDLKIEDVKIESAFLGGSSPDTFSKYLQPRLHSLDFAGFAYIYATGGQWKKDWENKDNDLLVYINLKLNEINESNELTSSSNFDPEPIDEFDPISFSLAFGSHIAEDRVGHYPETGYLTPEYNHPLEFAVDTYEVKQAEEKWSFVNWSADAIYFLYMAQRSFESWDPNWGHNSVEEIIEAVGQWRALTSTEAIAIKANVLYKREMRKWDNYGAKNWKEAEANYLREKGHSIQSAQFWINTIIETRDCDLSASMTFQYIDELMKK